MPTGELQRRRGSRDPMACTSFSMLNVYETKMNNLIRRQKISREGVQWLQEKGYLDENGKLNLSDRFNAILAGNTPQGNSLKAPHEAMRKYGAIPEKMLPNKENMTWEEFHHKSDITQEMYDLGKEFLEHFPYNYIRTFKHKFEEYLKTDPIQCALYAWPRPVNGIYPFVDRGINHATELFKAKWFIFDSYKDGYDGDFIKHLAPNYLLLHYGYRSVIREVRHWKIPNNVEVKVNQKTYKPGSWLSFWYWWNGIFHKLSSKNNSMKEFKPKVLQSSADPTKYAMTFKGVAVALIPLVIMIGKGFNLNIAYDDVAGLIEGITAAISAVMVVFGLGRKLYFKYLIK